jgi:hypothetical protein
MTMPFNREFPRIPWLLGVTGFTKASRNQPRFPGFPGCIFGLIEARRNEI